MAFRRNPDRCWNVTGVVTFAAHDALGRTVYTERSPTNGTVRTPVARMEYNGLGDLVRLQTYTNGTDVVVESYDYDVFGNCVRVEDALGNVEETVYDAAGNVVAESGATYPIRQEFDTQGRRIALCTTRDGIVWDVTRWTYDAATGLCTSKTYADGSVVTYTHTPDGFPLRTTYALSRPITRNDDVFAYNNRSEVLSSRRGAENAEAYSYDEIGNLLRASFNLATNVYAANNLNQYSSISTLRASVPPCETTPTYDTDGNMTAYGPWSYTYDSANRLATVSSNGVLLVTNFYDARGRRVKKVTQSGNFTFFYDGWNLAEEHIAYTNGASSTIHYYWGKDLSGTFQGAGGVGGLLYLTVDGVVYIPCYDNNGNITRYLDASGNVVAAYTYDAFGRTISQSGPLADVFRHRFSSKYFDGTWNWVRCKIAKTTKNHSRSPD